MKAAYGNLSTFVGYFHRDPRIVFIFFDLAGEGEGILNEDSTAINSSTAPRIKGMLVGLRPMPCTYLGRYHKPS